jgi:hypothetical protein
MLGEVRKAIAVQNDVGFRNTATLPYSITTTEALLGKGLKPVLNGKLRVLMSAAFATIFDNETGGIPRRELDVLGNDLKAVASYVYDVYGYHEKLGNQPPYSRDWNADPIMFRGAFLIQLTGRVNYEKYVIPVATLISQDRSSRALYNPAMIRDIRSASSGKFTNDLIDRLNRNQYFAFAVSSFFLLTPFDKAWLERGDQLDKDAAMDVLQDIVIQMGYPSVRKQWSTGGYTPSRNDILTRIIILYNSIINSL